MQKLASTLAKALIPGLTEQGYTLETVLGGELKNTNFDWQVPAIKCSDTLNGFPLFNYFQQPFSVNEQAFFRFWEETLYAMHGNPSSVWSDGGYKYPTRAMRFTKAIASFLFAMPDGAPGFVSEYAGVVFSLECANLYSMTSGVADVVSSGDDYYVITRSGRKIGVEGGLPLAAKDAWDYSASGVVEELLYQPRGAILNRCEYSVIDKVRCLVYQNKEKFPEYEGINQALQALRFLQADSSLLAALRTLKQVKESYHYKSNRLQEALDVLSDLKMSDRQKITSAKEILVPEVMGRGKFSKLVYPYHAEIPPSLKPGKVFQIIEKLKTFAEQEKVNYATTR